MNDSRRGFVKKAVIAGAVGAAGVATLQASTAKPSSSGGVVVGKSKKKEITYKKTEAWEEYYRSAL